MASGDSGIGLDENFDLLIDNSGDVGSFEDLEEMKKDLSGIISAYIDQNSIGTVLDSNKVREIESDVQTILENDDRVTNVVSISIRKINRQNVIGIQIEVDSIYGGIRFNVDGE